MLADHAAAFDAELLAELGPYAEADGRLIETVSFGYELARKDPAGI